MGDITVLALGAVCGFVIGWVLSRDVSRYARFYVRQNGPLGISLSTEQKQMQKHFIERYAAALPFILGVMFALAALAMFGSGRWVH